MRCDIAIYLHPSSLNRSLSFEDFEIALSKDVTEIHETNPIIMDTGARPGRTVALSLILTPQELQAYWIRPIRHLAARARTHKSCGVNICFQGKANIVGDNF
jgi:hypothetical protein